MSTKSTIRGKTLKNFLSLSLVQFANYVLPVITLPIISRIIGPEKFGVINYIYAFIGYFVLFISYGFDFYGTRYVANNQFSKESINKVFSTILYCRVLLLLATSILFFVCVSFIPQLRSEKLASLLSFLLCIGYALNTNWVYNGMQDARNIGIFNFVSKLLFSVLIIILIKTQSDYIYHPLSTSIAQILVSLVSLWYAIKKYKLSFVAVSFKEIQLLLKENGTLSLTSWITSLAVTSNIVVAGSMASAHDVGVYTSALRIITILQSLYAVPLNTVLFPLVSKSFSEDLRKGYEVLRKILPIIAIASIMFSVVTFLMADLVINKFYGSQFVGGVSLLRILSIVLFFSTLNNTFGMQVLLNIKRDKVYLKFISIGFVLNIVLIVALSNLFGITGAAYAWPLSEFVMFSIFIFYFLHNNIPLISQKYFTPSFIGKTIVEFIKK